MFIQIRDNDNIKSINITDFVIKLSAYADDTYFLPFDIQLLRHILPDILDTCSVFGIHSSLKLTLLSIRHVGLELQKVN